MKTPIEILKAHQAWRTHKCDSDGVNGCGKVECNMPITTPSEKRECCLRYKDKGSGFVSIVMGVV